MITGAGWDQIQGDRLTKDHDRAAAAAAAAVVVVAAAPVLVACVLLYNLPESN
jgi:hypothetical protein